MREPVNPEPAGHRNVGGPRPGPMGPQPQWEQRRNAKAAHLVLVKCDTRLEVCAIDTSWQGVMIEKNKPKCIRGHKPVYLRAA